MIFNKRLFIIILITISLGLNIVLSVQYALVFFELKNISKEVRSRQMNEKSLAFAKLFVDKFLMGQGTVGFEDRLALENAVREIKDPEIFKQWQEFTNSANDREAQISAGKLFNLLLRP